MKDLDTSLSELSVNYYGIINESDSARLLEAMRRFPHPENAPLDNSIRILPIKSAQKFAHNIIKYNIDLKNHGNKTSGFTVDQLLWLFNLGEFGINKIRTGNTDRLKKDSLPNIESHLLTHNAGIARQIAKQSGETAGILKIVYRCLDEATKVRGIRNPTYYFNLLADKMYTANDISCRLPERESLRWLRKSYGCSMGAIAYFKHMDKQDIREKYIKDFAYLHALAAETLEKLSEYKAEPWSIKMMQGSIDLDIQSAVLSKEFDIRHSAISRVNAARKAKKLYDRYRGGELDYIAQKYRKIALSNYQYFKNLFERANAKHRSEKMQYPKSHRRKSGNPDNLHQYSKLYKKVSNLIRDLNSEPRRPRTHQALHIDYIER